MASAVERRREEHSRRSRSPARDRERRGTPPRRRSSAERRKGSPARARSPPAKSSASHRDRERSPTREKVKERVRSPPSPAKASLSHKGRERSPPRKKAKDQRVRSPKHTQEQSRSPSPARRHVSRSPSPRTKRLRRAQGEREVAQATGSDRRKASHREELDTVRHREHDEGRDASRDRKVDREAVQVTKGDRRKSSHREERDSRGKHREHDEGRDVSRDRKSDREDTRGTVKDKKSDRDDGKDHSRKRRAGKDDRSGASKETLSSRDDDRHGRPNRDDWKSASSREQRLDHGDRRDSTREKPTDEESNGGSGRSSRPGRSVSPGEHRHRGRHESHPSPRVSRSAARTEDINSRGGEASRSGDPDALARMNATAEALEAKEKQKPSFELSGKLAEETNRVAGVNLLYSEPPEARKSEIRWRHYVFKDGEPLNALTMKTKRSKGSSPRVAAGRKIRTQLLRIELVSDGAQKATGDSEHDTQDERSNPSRMFPELHKLKLFKYQTPFNFPLPLISSLKPLIRSQKQGESGRFGKKCRVETNYFVVSLRDSDVYQYDVCISPEDRSCVVNRAVMRKLVSIHKSALNGCFPAYDGRNRLYTAISLPFTCKTFQIELQSIDQASCRKRKFEVVIKFVTNVRLQAVGHESEPKIDLQALEVILFEMFRRSCSIGKPFERGKGLEIQLSFNKNLQLTQKGLLLNIDVSSKVSMNSIHAKGQLNRTQISTRLKAPQLHPLERKYQILQAVKGNSYEEPYAKEFGIEIKKEPVSIDARVLPPPWLKFLDDTGWTKVIFPQAGRWNMIRKRMFNGGRVSNWTCLNFSCDVENEMVRSFCHELAVVCKASGMAFCPDPVIPVRTANPEDLELTLDLCYGEAMSVLQPLGRELDLLVVILPNNKGSLYGNLKRICETKIGLVSQCCLAKHVSRTSKQYLTNVALKINVKVGGRNTVLADSWRLPCVGDIPTIIFGGHVMHPERSNSPSIAAVVASQDWPDVTSYAALADVQASGQEWIHGLFGVSHFSGLGARTGGMIIEHLKSFYRKTGQKPQRIIYYRDSLSDKQRYQVMLQEVIAIKKACSYLEPGYMPSVTYVVLQKRRHARFFTEYNERERGRMFNGSGNVLPGTVVDSDICHPNEFGFYLCSQIGTQGTIQPVHYHILWDENSFAADTFQCLTNYLCYTYARCMHSVSIVPPVFYAHLMASRCRLYMDHTTEKVEGGQAPSPSEASSSWTIRLPTIKDNVKQGMFYC